MARFLETLAEIAPPQADARDRQIETLRRTLDDQVYPALEEFLSEMTRHGIGGQIYGRGTGYQLTLRLDDGFEIAFERERLREQSQLMPRLVCVAYYEEEGRCYCVTDGIGCSRIGKVDAIRRVVHEYERWRMRQVVQAG